MRDLKIYIPLIVSAVLQIAALLFAYITPFYAYLEQIGYDSSAWIEATNKSLHEINPLLGFFLIAITVLLLASIIGLVISLLTQGESKIGFDVFAFAIIAFIIGIVAGLSPQFVTKNTGNLYPRYAHGIGGILYLILTEHAVASAIVGSVFALKAY